ncbi:MAG: UDP-2,4-diacetamido-2,4,6-trideoxy-beta-L-altropyranose hydrolase [Candidatus Electrothrix sp. AUS1_2]|nr:UDP-2,4-diacetamido-2,4,6-trideoxy-beta-L-altropyranose hydrolase [Candidatus Electrothrix sp. AUS1_2]
MKVYKRRFLFRCDGTRDTGLGHVSRCIALAEALQECGAFCVFSGKFSSGAHHLLNSPGIIFEDLECETGSREDLDSLLGNYRLYNTDAIIVDSYFIDNSFLDYLVQYGVQIILIDDFNKLDYYQYHAVLNFTVNAIRLPYPCQEILCLLGPEYFLARRSLRRLRAEHKKHSSQVDNILVVMGGVDADNTTERIVRLLSEIASRLTVRVVVGSCYQAKETLYQQVTRCNHDCNVIDQLPDLTEQFAWCDVCICAGGLTKYEAAYLGIPAAVLSQNKEQAEETRHFARRGLAFDLGLHSTTTTAELASRLNVFLNDSVLRKNISEAGQACFPLDPTLQAAEMLCHLPRDYEDDELSE